ncbi:E1-E2 ATPase-domain-containing protein, partial [Hysterangium stoloniferum]
MPFPEEDIDPTPFPFNPWKLASLVDPKSLEALQDIGGVDALIKGLGTDAKHGLSEHIRTSPFKDAPYTATVQDRRRVYGENVLPAQRSKSLLLLMWLTLKNKVLVLLSITAVISLALGLFWSFSRSNRRSVLPIEVDWDEGVAIMVAIIIVVCVGILNDWQKERQFQKLNEREERRVKVIRNGNDMIIDVKEVLVGDIALLEPGEIVPCDGVLLNSRHVRCDESSITGTSVVTRKASYKECMAKLDQRELSQEDCFLLSGSKVLEGAGEYVVIAVGSKSFSGRFTMALREDTKHTLLQFKPRALAKLERVAGLIPVFSLMVMLLVQSSTLPGTLSVRTNSQNAWPFAQILTRSVTLIVVAVPEDLPLAMTVALAFVTRCMTKANFFEYVLDPREIMANVSVIGTDKTGTFTRHAISVV